MFQAHLLPMPNKLIAFFGKNETYKGWKNHLFNICCKIFSVNMQAGGRACLEKDGEDFLRGIKLTLVKALVNLLSITTRCN